MSVTFATEVTPLAFPCIMHVRSASRFQILAALVITSLLVYSVWIHSSTLDHRLENAWAGPAKRIVVFGDSFSTAAGGRVTKGTSEHEETRWTDVLLKEVRDLIRLPCSLHANVIV